MYVIGYNSLCIINELLVCSAILCFFHGMIHDSVLFDAIKYSLYLKITVVDLVLRASVQTETKITTLILDHMEYNFSVKLY